MTPAASTSSFYLNHPQSAYFSVGKIAADQLYDLAARCSIRAGELQRLLVPNLRFPFAMKTITALLAPCSRFKFELERRRISMPCLQHPPVLHRFGDMRHLHGLHTSQVGDGPRDFQAAVNSPARPA